MFTEVLNIVVLLAKPTVVTVTVQPAHCCYCSATVQHQSSNPYEAATQPKRARFAIFSISPEFEAISSDFEIISSDFERLAHRIRWKTKPA